MMIPCVPDLSSDYFLSPAKEPC